MHKCSLNMIERRQFKATQPSDSPTQLRLQKHIQVYEWRLGKHSKTIVLFSNSPYSLHIVDLDNPLPHEQVTTEHPITCFTAIQPSDNKLVVVVASHMGLWVAYELIPQKQSFSVKFLREGAMLGQPGLVGIHYLEGKTRQNDKILFLKDGCRFQYSNFGKGATQNIQNKQYKIKESEYLGRWLLEELAGSDNQGKAFISAMQGSDLYVGIKSSEGLYGVYSFDVSDYEVRAGIDNLLNLISRPLEILFSGKLVLVNLGRQALLWDPSLGRVQSYPLFADSNKMWCHSLCQTPSPSQFTFTSANQAFSLKIKQQTSNAKLPEIVIAPTPNLTMEGHNIIKLVGCGNKTFAFTDKLQLIMVSNASVVIANLHHTISYAELISENLASALVFQKRIGYWKERKVLTHKRVVLQTQLYQHNMLLKMSSVLRTSGDYAYVSSPIIGTLKLALRKDGNKCRLSMGESNGQLIGDEQSLYMDDVLQITPTKVCIFSPNPALFKVGSLFEDSVDMLVAGCRFGSYLAVCAQKQVHVFVLPGTRQPGSPLKRLCIHCTDEQIKQIIALNDVNSFLLELWDGHATLCRIQEDSVQVVDGLPTGNSIKGIGLLDHPHIQTKMVINTASYRATILQNGLLVICSDDPLLAYQPKKTTTHIMPLLPSWMQCHGVYPLLQNQTNPKMSLIVKYAYKRKDGLPHVANWCIVSLPAKALIKQFPANLELQLESIVAFPNSLETESSTIMFAAFWEDTFAFVTSNRIAVCKLGIGSLPLDPVLCPDLYRWVKQHSQMGIDAPSKGGSDELSKILLDPGCRIVRIDQTHALVHNEWEVWYCRWTSKGSGLESISYFSLTNESFQEFKNNLSVGQLENSEFMKIFAEKMPIQLVVPIDFLTFLVLYHNLLLIVRVGVSQALTILQQINLQASGILNGIAEFLGASPGVAVFLRDHSHRLLRLESRGNQYQLSIGNQIEDELVCMYGVRRWRQRGLKLTPFNDDAEPEEQQLIIRKDGRMIVGDPDESKPVYL